MLSTERHGDDVWCVDPHGTLTLSVSKETYEKLGLIGQKLPFKNRVEQYGESWCHSVSLGVAITWTGHSDSPTSSEKRADGDEPEEEGRGAQSLGREEGATRVGTMGCGVCVERW